MTTPPSSQGGYQFPLIFSNVFGCSTFLKLTAFLELGDSAFHHSVRYVLKARHVSNPIRRTAASSQHSSFHCISRLRSPGSPRTHSVSVGFCHDRQRVCEALIEVTTPVFQPSLLPSFLARSNPSTPLFLFDENAYYEKDRGHFLPRDPHHICPKLIIIQLLRGASSRSSKQRKMQPMHPTVARC